MTVYEALLLLSGFGSEIKSFVGVFVGNGTGFNSGGYSSALIGLNAKALSIVERSSNASFFSRLPCIKANL